MQTQPGALPSTLLSALLASALLITSLPVVAASHAGSKLEQCQLDALRSAEGQHTVENIKQQCQHHDMSGQVIERRVDNEQAVRDNPFGIIAHRANYLQPYNYNMRPNDLGLYGYDLQRAEVKFQFSFKFPIGKPLWDDRVQFYGAYTNQSWWQAYNRDASAPFRETNHEPEIFATIRTDLSLFGFDSAFIKAGISHQSNGQSGLRSRSWNRIYAGLILEKERWVVGIKPWIRLPEDPKTSPTDPKGDDNPDIEDFTGHYEIAVFRRFNHKHSLTALMRHNFRSHKGAIQLGYSYPLNKRFKGYIELFDGYAESLIDYNHRNTRIGVGIQLTGWL